MSAVEFIESLGWDYFVVPFGQHPCVALVAWKGQEAVVGQAAEGGAVGLESWTTAARRGAARGSMAMGFEIPVDVDYFDHPKTVMLRGLIGEEADIYPLRLWRWCALYAKDGVVNGGMAQIESAMRWSGKPSKLHKAMIRCGFIEDDGVTVGFFKRSVRESITKNDRSAQRILDQIADKPLGFRTSRPDLSSSRWRALRLQVISENGPICHYCKQDCSDDPTVDHIDPVSAGVDPYLRSNLVVACRRCNSKKGGAR